MILNKWNYMEKQYDKVDVGEGNFKSYSNNMDEIVNCPHCKKAFRYGDGYTSNEFHTKFGFGYVVCHTCYEEEWVRRKKDLEYSKEDS